MKGCEKREQRRYELATFHAWQTARLSNYEQRLEPVKHYLDELRPSQPVRKQSPEEMIAALRAVKASMH